MLTTKYSPASIKSGTLTTKPVSIVAGFPEPETIAPLIEGWVTIMAKENFEVVEKFLASHPNFEQILLDHIFVLYVLTDAVVDCFISIVDDLEE